MQCLRKAQIKSFLVSISSLADLGWQKITTIQLLGKTTLRYAECLFQSEFFCLFEIIYKTSVQFPTSRYENRHCSFTLNNCLIDQKEKKCYYFEDSNFFCSEWLIHQI